MQKSIEFMLQECINITWYHKIPSKYKILKNVIEQNILLLLYWKKTTTCIRGVFVWDKYE